jgi:hypothetical protein
MTDSAERSTLVDYAATFAPWLCYILATLVLGSWRFGFVLGFAASAAVVGWRMIHGDRRFIDLGTLGYCTAMAGVSVAFPRSPIGPYNIPLSMTAFGALSLISLAIRSPFTYQVARDKVPQWILDDPDHHGRLRRAHVTATAAWAAAQITAGVSGIGLIEARLAAAVVATQVAGTLMPAGVTRYQHDRSVRLAGPAPRVPDSTVDQTRRAAEDSRREAGPVDRYEVARSA